MNAHIDTLSQVIKPDPLVKSYEAESLTLIGKAKIIDDKEASGGKAVELNGENAGFKLDLGTLPVGMHVLFLCGKVIDPEATYKGQVS